MENSSTNYAGKGFSNYMHLQKVLDKVLGKLGLHTTIMLLENLAEDKKLDSDFQKAKVIREYVIAQAIRIFDLDEKKFYDSTVREYREARMAVYHLLRKYTASSYSQIGDRFSQPKRNVIYFTNKCSEVLTVPQYHPVFSERYQSLEVHTTTFISKIK